jgi:hypothetical protein
MIDINGLMTMMSVCVKIHEGSEESQRAKAVRPNTSLHVL